MSPSFSLLPVLLPLAKTITLGHAYFNLDSLSCMCMCAIGKRKYFGKTCREMTNTMIYDDPHMILLW